MMFTFLCLKTKVFKCFVHHRKSIGTIVKTEINVQENAKRNCALREAEKMLGHPTSLLNMSWMLNDKFGDEATAFKMLIRRNNSLLKAEKNLLLGNEHAPWGLIILLISKLAGKKANISDLEGDKPPDIRHDQSILVEVIKMMHTSHLMHKSVVNSDCDGNRTSEFNLNNSLALLFGDHLVGRIVQELACIKNGSIQETMYSCLRDLAESQFIGLRNRGNQPFPSKPVQTQMDVAIPIVLGIESFKAEDVLGHMKAEWTLRNILGGGSLVGKGCQCVMALASYESDVQKLGNNFGRHLALAWQACEDKDSMKEEQFSLVSAPVMFHLEYDPDFYKEIEKGLLAEGTIDYDAIRKTVLAGPGLEKTLDLQNHFSRLALDTLEKFPDCESKAALTNIIKAI